MAGTWRIPKLLAASAALCTVLTAAPAHAHVPDARSSVTRIWGDDRIATAVEVSHALFPSGGAPGAVLSRADGFADALAGTPLAATKRAPLLLTPTGALDSRVLTELRRVLAPGRTVYLLGGRAALSAEVEQAVAAAGFTPARLAGETRYDTAVRVAEALQQPTRILLATGTDFADALAAGPAAGNGGVVLLTAGSTLPQPVADYLSRHPAPPRFAIGGQASAAVPGAEAIVGADRFETAARVAARFFTDPPVVGVASGEGFADALAGGAHAAQRGGALLLTRGGELPPPIRDQLLAHRASVVAGFVYGGPAAVSEPVVTSVAEAISDPATRAALALLVPNGGEVVAAGGQQVVQWAYEGEEAPLRIELLSGTGTTQTVATGLSATAGSHTWAVPNMTGDAFRIRVVVEPAAGSAIIVDLSDATFAIHDVTAPSLAEMDVTPTSVDTSSAPADLTFRARITDNLSGVWDGPPSTYGTEISARFDSPSGQKLDVLFPASSRVSGTALDGVYRVTKTLPQRSESGTWTFVYMKTLDAANNVKFMHAADLEAAGLKRTFEQTGSGDGAAPVVASLQMTPTTVDTASGPATVAVRARITDAGTGLRPGGDAGNSNHFRLVSPSGQFAIAVVPQEPTTGTATDGTYDFSLALPRYSEQGTWRIESAYLVDFAGNVARPTGADLASRGLPTTIQQTGPGDTQPPKLAGFQITPTTVATSTGPAKIVFRVTVTDDLAGVDRSSTGHPSSFEFKSPSWSQGLDLRLFSEYRISGTPTNGVFEIEATLPQFAEQGTWTLRYMVLRDDVGNQVLLQPGDVDAAGFPTTFEVRG